MAQIINTNILSMTAQSNLNHTQASLATAEDQYRQALLAFWTARADFERALGEE